MPEPIRPHATHVYKTVGQTSIEVDIHLPVPVRQLCPVLAFFHGGAWLGGNRGEYCRPLFQHFLAKGFIVASFDYRLLPESEFVRDQLADVRDAGAWIHDQLPAILSRDSYEMSRDDVVVAGSSAGALLALLTVCAARILRKNVPLVQAADWSSRKSGKSHPKLFCLSMDRPI